MLNLYKLAIIGSGPTATFLLQNIVAHIAAFKSAIGSITIFEKEEILGIGMPFRENTTDKFNLANITSEEIPKLPQSLGNWLRKQDHKLLKEWNITEFPIDDKKVYSRIALGHYFQDQFAQLLSVLAESGISINQCGDCEIVDISAKSVNEVALKDKRGAWYNCTTVAIANGHAWNENDNPKAGYFASPWPIQKLFPQKNKYYNFPIGTLGASLSAFDVVVSLAQRHGDFVKNGNELQYKIYTEAQGFKLILHSAEGWLPHLQYEQVKPMRTMYRHFTRQQLHKLVDRKGFLHLEDYFDNLCRPALIVACAKDNQPEIVAKLEDKNFSFKDFVKLRAEKHAYVNSFKGMQKEMKTAVDSVKNDNPIHWMETLDDLMFTLNYHAELLPAEDHIFLKKEVFTFLMNVVAALPLQSANVLLALYNANCIELKSGLVTVKDADADAEQTTIKLAHTDGTSETKGYKMFVDCSGQKHIDIKTYPFPTLAKKGIISGATAEFSNLKIAEKQLRDGENDDIILKNKERWLKLPGIAIDAKYRTIDENGKPNDFLFNLNFTHTMGLRPYSYGLQACNTTSAIVVDFWLSEI